MKAQTRCRDSGSVLLLGWWRNLLHSLCTFCTFSNTAAGPNPVTRVSKGCAEMYISPHRSDHNSRHKCTVDVELGLKPVVATMMAGPKVVFSLYSSFRQFEITGSSVLYLLSLDFANLFFLSICNLLQANYWNGR